MYPQYHQMTLDDYAYRELQELGKHYDQPIAVECLPLANFYPAEEYHQKYLEKNPNGYCHLDPGLFEQAYEQSRAK